MEDASDAEALASTKPGVDGNALIGQVAYGLYA